MNLPIKVKLAGIVVLCLGAIAAANAVMARSRYDQEMRFAAEQAVKAAAQSFDRMERHEVDKLSSTLDALLSEPTLAAYFAQRDREHLYESAAPIFQVLKQRHAVTHWYFIDPAPASTCFLRVHRPELHDDVIGRATLQAAVRGAETASGKELGQTAFALRVVRPFVSHGKLLGYMELGEEIDDFITRMRAETGDEFGLVVQKQFLDEKAWASSRGARRNSWADDPDVVTVDVSDAEAPIVGSSADARDVPAGGRYLAPVERGASLFVRGVVPVLDAAGRKVGGLFVLHDVTALRDRYAAERNRANLAVGAVAAAMLVLLVLAFDLLVFRRLVGMTRSMEDVATRLAGGDYEVGSTIRPRVKDELGRFEEFLGGFLSMIGTTLRELEKRRRGA
jgi:HAMP domain-containing protein